MTLTNTKRSKDSLNTRFENNIGSKVIEEIKDSNVFNLGENCDGVEASVHFIKDYMKQDEADELYEFLKEELNWQQREGYNNFGGVYREPRMTYWLGKPYKYSSVEWGENNTWHPRVELLLNQLCKDQSLAIDPKKPLNSVMCNWYRSGNDSIGWHSDDETSLGRCPTIASISLGVTRFFDVCKRKDYYNRQGKIMTDRQTFAGCSKMYRFHLNNGSLLLMKGSVQDDWLHRVPRGNDKLEGRINLTFRHIVEEDEERKEIEWKKERAKAKRFESITRKVTSSTSRDSSLNEHKKWISRNEGKMLSKEENEISQKKSKKKIENDVEKLRNSTPEEEKRFIDKETNKDLKRKKHHPKKEKWSENLDCNDCEMMENTKKAKKEKKKKKKKKKDKKEKKYEEKENECSDSEMGKKLSSVDVAEETNTPDSASECAGVDDIADDVLPEQNQESQQQD